MKFEWYRPKVYNEGKKKKIPSELIVDETFMENIYSIYMIQFETIFEIENFIFQLYKIVRHKLKIYMCKIAPDWLLLKLNFNFYSSEAEKILSKNICFFLRGNEYFNWLSSLVVDYINSPAFSTLAHIVNYPLHYKWKVSGKAQLLTWEWFSSNISQHCDFNHTLASLCPWTCPPLFVYSMEWPPSTQLLGRNCFFISLLHRLVPSSQFRVIDL